MEEVALIVRVRNTPNKGNGKKASREKEENIDFFEFACKKKKKKKDTPNTSLSLLMLLLWSIVSCRVRCFVLSLQRRTLNVLQLRNKRTVSLLENIRSCLWLSVSCEHSLSIQRPDARIGLLCSKIRKVPNLSEKLRWVSKRENGVAGSFTSSPMRSPFSRSVSNAAWYSLRNADWKSSVN